MLENQSGSRDAAADTGIASDHDVTDLLLAWREGDADASERLFPLVYHELHRIAQRQLRGERAGHTLETTGLVHEAFLRLVDQNRTQWLDRGHFFAVAARVMRRVLIDYARRRAAGKRGHGYRQVDLDEGSLPLEERPQLLLALDEALTRLGAEDERIARVVECRFFGGLTEEETGLALGVTARTVRRDWVKGRAWLYRELAGES
ncbi:MAG TPA: sigma-70 family RNA polymerase sigma factor [Gemmatimonadales bacterium]|jgi:RNA polymerase sigma factor (TIGR02999 family)